MSESKFLPFQDVDGDGQNDQCPEEFRTPEPIVCPECQPNSSAIVPDWREKKRLENFLNEKNCKYQVTVVAKDYTGTNAPEGGTEAQATEALQDIYKEYEDSAIEALLQKQDKSDSDSSKQAVRDAIEYTDYYLSPRVKTRLKLLYSVPHEVIFNLDPREDDEDDDEESPGNVTVTYSVEDMDPWNVKVRQGLSLYMRYLKVYRAIEGANLLFLDGNRVFNLQNYGDWGLGSSNMSKVLSQLDTFLNSIGYNLPNVGNIFSEMFNANNVVTEMTFTFEEYEIKKISMITEGCGGKPIILTKLLDSLKEQSAWKDKTAMAYFTKLQEMVNDLEARTPKPWVEFLKEYTYPEIYSTKEVTYEDTETPGSCMGEAMAEFGTELGQDLLDDVFSIGDAVAFKFHDQLCKLHLGEKLDEDIKIGTVIDPNMYDEPTTAKKENEKNIRAFATEQAFKELKDSESPFTALCAKIVTGMGTTGNASSDKMLEVMWKEGLDDLKICGLFDILMEAITCLFSGLTLEEALGKMLEAGLRAMSINNFADLMIGLPYDKQQEIGAMAKEKIEKGDVFPDGGMAQQLSDGIAGEVKLPSAEEWAEAAAEKEVDKNKPTAASNTKTGDSADGTRTLATDYDGRVNSHTYGPGEDMFGPGWNAPVLEAYVQALLDVYSENYLELFDFMDKFPGSQLIANIILAADCPKPAFFNPGLFEWMNDIELPLCKNINDIRWPEFQHPSAWYPDFHDLLKVMMNALKLAIQMAIIKIIMRLIVKICELIGNAICNALGTVGDVVASLPDLASGRSTLTDVIKESICGDDADDEKVNDTIVDMVAKLGVGGAALANREQAIEFAQMLSLSLTEAELYQALLGDPTDATLGVIENLVEYEFPEYQQALPNQAALGSFLGNMGNLFPPAFKAELQDRLDTDAEDSMPANPSICADPAKLEEFKELRCEILEGRATPDQCTEMYDNMRQQMMDDLGDMASAVQALSSPEALGQYLEDQMPPIISDPGCDNGLVPFEPAVTVATVTSALGNELEQLKVDYSTDMLGNGPFDADWGMINMMLSDTMGNPLTTHMRKTTWNPMYKDFAGGWDPSVAEMVGIATYNPFLATVLLPFTVMTQTGMFPTKVAAYLQDQMNDMAGSISVNPNNDWAPDYDWDRSLEALGMGGLFGGDLNLAGIPDLGYNIDTRVDVDGDGEISGVTFIRKGRKATPDLEISFSDNARGKRSLGESVYSYGYDIQAFFGDLTEDADGNVVSLKSDNVRIKIMERFNQGADIDSTLESAAAGDDIDVTDTDADNYEKEATKGVAGEDAVIENRKFEFMAIDNTLTGISDTINDTLSEYPKFMAAFQGEKNYAPQTILLKEMISDAGTDAEASAVNNLRAEVMQNMLETIFETIADVEGEDESPSNAWAYGAKYDDLTAEDVEYGVVEDGVFIKIADTDYTNDDMMLGMSYNQYKMEYAEETPDKTRVFYLDPATFGGNYMSPPLYIKPETPEGWMGVVDIFFPELSPCKPQSTDLIDFGEIQDQVSSIYPTLADDERLKGEEECIIEVPYNRIMERASRAGMYGLIIAAIRIHVSAHMLKTLPTFTKFAPKFPDVFSSAYASYIVESMEASLKEAEAPWEIFNTFRDNEFWYGFLEQCVELYNHQVNSGEVDPSPEVLEAMFRLNDLQEAYAYPDADDLKVAKGVNEASFFDTLKDYRMEKNMAAIMSTEEDAKLIMKELVAKEVNYMAEKLMANFGKLNLKPEVADLDYYIMENMTAGAVDELTLNSAINSDGTFKATYGSLPEIPYEENESATEPYYTSGAELIVKDNAGTEFTNGQEYIGYYHVHIDEDYAIVYMAGQYHSEDAHAILQPVSNIISIPFGDVPAIGTVSAIGDTSKPYLIEKYISIDGTKMTPDEAVVIIRENDPQALISEIYPGSMKLVEDDEGNPTGIEGELGVRYGIRFSIDLEGTRTTLTTVEIDALDLPIKDFTTLAANGKNLLCLINHLKKSDVFQLVTRYIFGSSKLVSIAAIYNDMGMLASIGENTVASGEYRFDFSPGYTSETKPGLWKTVDYTQVENDEGETVDVVSKITVDEGPDYTGPSGAWASAQDRAPSPTQLFVLSYDEWDRQLLKNSNGRIKKLFKHYYTSRDFNPDDIGKSTRGGPAMISIKKLLGALRPTPGKQLIPWWQKGKLRTNPFNANDELCKKED